MGARQSSEQFIFNRFRLTFKSKRKNRRFLFCFRHDDFVIRFVIPSNYFWSKLTGISIKGKLSLAKLNRHFKFKTAQWIFRVLITCASFSPWIRNKLLIIRSFIYCLSLKGISSKTWQNHEKVKYIGYSPIPANIEIPATGSECKM